VLHITKHDILSCIHARTRHGHSHTHTHTRTQTHMRTYIFMSKLYSSLKTSFNCTFEVINVKKQMIQDLHYLCVKTLKIYDLENRNVTATEELGRLSKRLFLFVIYVPACSLVFLGFWLEYNPNIFTCTYISDIM
jgi:hypothetical protein